jgi:malate dehydrogenase
VCACVLLQGSATLSMAYAAALFADACLRGMNGATATECTYVESEVTDLPFFATKVKLGTEGERRMCCWRRTECGHCA